LSHATLHSPPPPSNVIPDADGIGTVLIKPVHPLDATHGRLLGNADAPAASGVIALLDAQRGQTARQSNGIGLAETAAGCFILRCERTSYALAKAKRCLCSFVRKRAASAFAPLFAVEGLSSFARKDIRQNLGLPVR
jgi:hypothetical protein